MDSAAARALLETLGKEATAQLLKHLKGLEGERAAAIGRVFSINPEIAELLADLEEDALLRDRLVAGFRGLPDLTVGDA